MPCKCSGFKVSQCSCKVVGARYPWDGELTNGLVLLAQPNSFSNVRPSKEANNYNLQNIIDHLYEKCTSFNLRYCTNRGFRKYDHNFRRTLKDLLILFCFIFANIVILSTILSKTAFHLYYAIMETAHWMWRYLGPKLFPSKSMQNPIYLTPYTHNFTPDIKLRNGIFY